MKASEVMDWLGPVERWVNGVAQAESDPDGSWHQTLEAWNWVVEAWNATYPEGANNIEHNAPEIPLELPTTTEVHHEEAAEAERVPDLRAETVEAGRTEEDSGGEPSTLLGESLEEVDGDDRETEDI